MVWNEFMNGLPEPIANFFRSLFRQKRVKWLLLGLVWVLLWLLLQPILGGYIDEWFLKSAVPWFRTRQLIPRILLCLLLLLSALLPCAVFFAWVIYKRPRGQEVIRQQQQEFEQTNRELTAEITSLKNDVGQLQTRTESLQSEHAGLTAQLIKLQADSTLLDIVNLTDLELFQHMSHSVPTDEATTQFVGDLFVRTFELWGFDEVCRASVMTPSAADPLFLTIRWKYGIGDESARWDKWYIGPESSNTIHPARGIPGIVYVTGKGRYVSNVQKEKDFVDLHQPKRHTLPYNSLVQALIHPDNPEQKLGVLSFDSRSHVFDDDDLALVSQVAIRIGWLLQYLQKR